MYTDFYKYIYLMITILIFICTRDVNSRKKEEIIQSWVCTGLQSEHFEFKSTEIIGSAEKRHP